MPSATKTLMIRSSSATSRLSRSSSMPGLKTSGRAAQAWNQLQEHLRRQQQQQHPWYQVKGHGSCHHLHVGMATPAHRAPSLASLPTRLRPSLVEDRGNSSSGGSVPTLETPETAQALSAVHLYHEVIRKQGDDKCPLCHDQQHRSTLSGHASGTMAKSKQPYTHLLDGKGQQPRRRATLGARMDQRRRV